MRDVPRLNQLAQDSGVAPADKLRPLRPLEPRPTWSSAADKTTARGILSRQRTSSDAWKDPTKQKRRFLRSKGKNDTLANPEKWTFSRAERSSALDAHIRALGSVGVAQALLDFDTVNEPLDVNKIYMDGGAVSERKRDSIIVPSQKNDWLEYVTGKQSLDYVTFLASYPTRQEAKDKALSVALSNKWMTIVNELLRYGANPNGHQDAYFLPAVADGDFELVEMFLSAPNSLNEATINAGLLEATKRGSSRMIALLLAHGADPNHAAGQALETAVRQRKLGDVAVICARSEKTLKRNTLDRAIAAACTIRDDSEKLRLVETLLCAGAEANHASVQDFLLEAVRKQLVSSVQLLITHGTSSDRNDGECLQTAVRAERADLVEILVQGELSVSSTSNALPLIPDESAETAFQSLLAPLLEKGVTKEALSACLARVVAKHFGSLATMLIRRGASLDHNDAECVRFALRESNIDLLQTLLQGPCEPSILARALPDALSIRPVSVRRDTMNMLLNKGVSGRELHQALCTVLGEIPDSVDYKLLEMLVRGNASVDFTGADGNCIQIAARRRDLTAIQLLCQGRPSPDTVSSTLPGLVSGLNEETYSVTLEILSTLLAHGAVEAPLAEALNHAVERDHGGRIIDLLLTHRADVNHQNARAIKLALSTSNLRALQLICEKGTLEQETFKRLLPYVLDRKSFSIDKARLLLPCGREFTGVLDLTLIHEVRALGSRPEVVDLLLQLDASVDCQDGAALTIAIQNEDTEITRTLLSRNPSARSLSLALEAAAAIRAREGQLDFMRLVLEHGNSSANTRNGLLLREVEATTGEDLRFVKLLLDHGASVDYETGAPLQAAVRQRNVAMFDLLMAEGRPRPETISYAFATARSTSLTVQEALHVFSSLFGACARDAFGNQISQALVEAVNRDSPNLAVPRLLLEHGASVDYKTGITLQTVVRQKNLPMFDLLMAEGRPGPNSVTRAFTTARSTTLSTQETLHVFSALLEACPRESFNGHINEALIEAVHRDPSDLTVPRLLLGHGASVNFNGGLVIQSAATTVSLPLMELLFQNQVDVSRVAVSAAFEQLIDTGGMRLAGGFQIAQILLQRGVVQRNIDHAMSMAFSTPEQVSLKDVALILSHGADVNAANGCFSCMLHAKTTWSSFTCLCSIIPIVQLLSQLLFEPLDRRKLLSGSYNTW